MPAAGWGAPSLGVDLLTARDADKAGEFAAAARPAQSANARRSRRLILEEAIAMAATQANAPFLLVAGEGWHPGVVGIVAGRLKERFAKPAFVAGFEGGMGRGSARSIPGIDIGAIIRAAARGQGDRIWRRPCHGGGLLADGGAAGRLSAISSSDSFAGAGPALAAASDLYLDAVSSPAGANIALAAEIAAAGPFGAGNPEPLLGLPDVRVAFADVVGRAHVKLRLAGGDGTRAGRHRLPGGGHAPGRRPAGGPGQAHPCGRAAAPGRLERPDPGSAGNRGCGARQEPDFSILGCQTGTWPLNPGPSGSALRLSVRTQDFHSCKRGSTPLGRTKDQLSG